MKLRDQTRAWFALTPLLGGAMVAISRTEDNRRKLGSPGSCKVSADHADHWQDVLVGSCLGLAIGMSIIDYQMIVADLSACVSYRTYYREIPTLWSPAVITDKDSSSSSSPVSYAPRTHRE